MKEPEGVLPLRESDWDWASEIAAKYVTSRRIAEALWDAGELHDFTILYKVAERDIYRAIEDDDDEAIVDEIAMGVGYVALQRVYEESGGRASLFTEDAVKAEVLRMIDESVGGAEE